MRSLLYDNYAASCCAATCRVVPCRAVPFRSIPVCSLCRVSTRGCRTVDRIIGCAVFFFSPSIRSRSPCFLASFTASLANVMRFSRPDRRFCPAQDRPPIGEHECSWPSLAGVRLTALDHSRYTILWGFSAGRLLYVAFPKLWQILFPLNSLYLTS